MSRKKGELTAKERKFTEMLVQGLTQSAAYRKAFGENGKSESTINSAASRLAKNVKVLQYRRELEQGCAGSAIASRTEILETHTVIMRDKSLSPKDRQRSMSELVRMTGGYAPDEVVISGEVEVSPSEEMMEHLAVLLKKEKGGS